MLQQDYLLVSKFFIFVFFIVNAMGFRPNSYEAEYLAEIKRQSYTGECNKAEDLRCPRSNMTFLLYTRKTQHNPTVLDQFNLYLLKFAPFVYAPLKFIVHGYSDTKDTGINAVLRPENLTCSHARAYEYYAESIGNPDRMVSFRCRCWRDYVQGRCPVPKPTDLVIVGENINYKIFGNFLVFTNAEKPFLVDPTRYLNNASFSSFRVTEDNNCCNNLDLKSCNYNIYCLLLRTFRT